MDLSMNVSVPRISIEDYEYGEFLKDDVVVTVYLILLSIVGSIGNGHALLIYLLRYKPSTYRMFVLWLAAVDFIACSINIPFEIVDIRHGFTFESSGACKFFRFLIHLATLSSGALLMVIAIERYRKACCPFGRQLEIKESAIACLITVGVSFVLSLPSFYIYMAAVKETSIPGLVGTDCTTGDDSRKSVFRVYSVFLLILSTLMFTICIIVYSFVGRAMYKQLTFRKSKLQLNKKSSNDSSLNGNKVQDFQNENKWKAKIAEEESSMHSSEARKTRVIQVTPSVDTLTKRRNRLDRSMRITLMFIIATAVSYIGYVPNLIILLIRAANPSLYRIIDTGLGMFTPVLLRGYFLSNVTNPLVYCFVDDRFRREIKNFYKNLKQLLNWRNRGVVV